MTDEPIYNYVRGVGWVVNGEKRVRFSDNLGDEWYAIERMPAPGERWDATRGDPPLELRVEVYKRHNVASFPKWREGDDAAYYKRYWVFVPVEGDR